MSHSRIDVILKKGGGGGGGYSGRTSAVRTVENSRQNMGNKGAAKSYAMVARFARTGDIGSFGLYGGLKATAMGVIVQESIKVASKGIDIFLDVKLAATGETIGIGNTKRLKGYILKPTSYIWDATYGVYTQKLKTNRQNEANAYYRELSGNLIVGNQYGKVR